MLRVGLPASGFLIAAPITLAAPLVLAAWVNAQPVDHLLNNTYYIVLPPLAWLWLVAAPLLFGLVYLGGQRFAGLKLRQALVWLHLVLWVLGAGTVIAPTSVVQVSSEAYTVGFAADFDALGRVLYLGYCVTLLSAAVFAICSGEAVLRRLRAGNEL